MVTQEWVPAQGQDPDIGPFVYGLSREFKKQTDQLSNKEIWAHWDLLEVQEGVLYQRWAERTLSAKGRMLLPQGFVKEALTEVDDGPESCYLGRMKTLRKIKARFWWTFEIE